MTYFIISILILYIIIGCYFLISNYLGENGELALMEKYANRFKYSPGGAMMIYGNSDVKKYELLKNDELEKKW